MKKLTPGKYILIKRVKEWDIRKIKIVACPFGGKWHIGTALRLGFCWIMRTEQEEYMPCPCTDKSDTYFHGTDNDGKHVLMRFDSETDTLLSEKKK